MSLSAGTVIDHYEIRSLLGAGGMGEVYLAYDTNLRRTVAMKILPVQFASDRERMGRFVQEARAAAALNHPHIGHVYEISEAEGTNFIVMEYVDGDTLGTKIHKDKTPLPEILKYLVQVTEGLTKAHTNGIVHRDLKPENIMITRDGYAKILDFGLAKLVEQRKPVGGDSPLSEARTEWMPQPSMQGMIMGTAGYMSPEQAQGRVKEIDHRTDIFSFGCILFEAVTGRMAFEGKDQLDTLHKIIHGPMPQIKDVNQNAPDELQKIIRRCLAKDPERRYQTIKDVGIELEDLREGLRDLAEPGHFHLSQQRAEDISARGISQPETEIVAPSVRGTVKRPATTAVSSVEYVVNQVKQHKLVVATLLIALSAGLVFLGVIVYKYISHSSTRKQAPQRALSRFTYDSGLQSEPTWSPDGRFIAYSSDRSGNYDIWVQPVAGGDPVQVTKSPAQDWQPDWSSQGSNLVFRSERDGGGIYVVPVLGGIERRVASYGYRPRWSPDGNKILFFSSNIRLLTAPPKAYVGGLDGAPPQEVLTQFLAGFKGRWEIDWYPDGESVSIWGERLNEGRGFWTASLAGGVPVRSEISTEVEQATKTAGVDLRAFQWSPNKDAIFFEGVSRGVTNLWKIDVDVTTQRWQGGPERLTVGAGDDVDVAISRDGSKIAFVTRTKHASLWSLPFDAVASKINGPEQRITGPELNPERADLARDGTKLVIVTERAGTYELRLHSFADNSERALATTDKLQYMNPRLSRDNSRVVVAVDRALGPDQSGYSHTSDHSIWVVSTVDGSSLQITDFNQLNGWPWDWTADQTMVLASSARQLNDHWGLYLFPIGAAPHAENQIRLVTEHPGYEAYGGIFSPNELWIVFEAGNMADVGDRRVYVVSTSSGEWIPISPEGEYAVGGCWSPDGRTLYFRLNRGGYVNIWGRRFDSTTGKPISEPFRVTNYESLGRQLDALVGVSADRLVVRSNEMSGGVWVLDHVNQ